MARTKEMQMIFDRLRVKTTQELVALASDKHAPWTARKVAYAIWKGRTRNEGLGTVCLECLCFNCICKLMSEEAVV